MKDIQIERDEEPHFLWHGSDAELVALLRNEKRRALHDYIAGVVVAQTRDAGIAA